VSRFFKVGLADSTGKAKPFQQIANDGNLLPHPVTLTEMDEQGIAERYDCVIDFTQFKVGEKAYFVNLCEHQDGLKPAADVKLADAFAGKSADPCVGKMLEFRIVREPSQPDLSQVPTTLIPNPDLSNIPVARERVFEFGRGASQPILSDDPSVYRGGPWGVNTDGNKMYNAAFSRISAAPKYGTREVWTLKNGGGGWDHPIHIHFEEGQVLGRNGSLSNVLPAERGRKDVYRLHPGGSITITMQFRDWGGMFMEHCHNTVHEDNAMLVRWDINGGGDHPSLVPLPTPVPSPTGVSFINPEDIAPTAF